MHTAEL